MGMTERGVKITRAIRNDHQEDPGHKTDDEAELETKSRSMGRTITRPMRRTNTGSIRKKPIAQGVTACIQRIAAEATQGLPS